MNSHLMNNTLRHRTVKREGFEWALEVHEVIGKTYDRQLNVRRNGEGWAVVHRKNNGSLKVLPILPFQKIPESVMIEIRKDLS
jgi:hypothetical protein